jgi:glycosyltransferase involved in cell wall biosynthesis
VAKHVKSTGAKISLASRDFKHTTRKTTRAESERVALLGGIDTACFSQIRGWVQDSSDSGEPFLLELIRDDVVLDRLTVLSSSFVFYIAPDLLTDGVNVLHVRCADTGLAIPGSPVTIEVSPQQSSLYYAAGIRENVFRHHVDGINATSVVGWIAKPDQPDHRCVVVLKAGEQIVARQVASEFRDDLAAQGLGDGRYGFKLCIPELSLRQALFVVVEETSGLILNDEPLFWQTEADDSELLGGIGSEMLLDAGLPSPARPDYNALTSITRTSVRKFIPATQKALALIATRNYLPFAKLTARSFLGHHPDFRVFLLLVDGEPADVGSFDEGYMILLVDLGFTNTEWHAAKFTAVEFSNALKPVFLRYLSGFCDFAIYLDCDIAVFSRLTEMIEASAQYDMIVIPHMFSPPPKPEHFWVHPSRADTFNAGLINAGCFALNLRPCLEFLLQWEEMNFAPGSFYREAGFQTDQQNFNWAVVSVDTIWVLRDPRYNVAYWNLHERDLRAVKNQTATFFEVNGRPLGFFHFSGYDIHNRLTISEHDGRHSVYNLPAVAEILNWYSNEILSSDLRYLLHSPYRYDTMGNGIALNSFIRNILKKYEIYIPHFDAFTIGGAHGLCSFLMDPLPYSRSLLPLVAAEIYEARQDLQLAFPDAHVLLEPTGFRKWFFHHAGVEFHIDPLINGFRRTLTSDPLRALAEDVGPFLNGNYPKFLGSDRRYAEEYLRQTAQVPLADALIEATNETPFASDVAAVLSIHSHRPDLQGAFPDIIGKDHQQFCYWVIQHAPQEHGCPPAAVKSFLGCTADVCLPRIFNYLSRQEHLAELCRNHLLNDDCGPLMRALIADAGQGLEYELKDIVIFAYIHEHSRHLLVPLYLELPVIRLFASRVRGRNEAALPEAVRGTSWAQRGCQLHASYFDPFHAVLDEETRSFGNSLRNRSSDVLDYLRVAGGAQNAIDLIEPAYRAAVKRSNSTLTFNPSYELRGRKERPGVNLFGYFPSDIGVGESSRGLAAVLGRLRPVNRVPFCTGQLQNETPLTELFQRFDYLTDTNIYVSYPHQRTDLLSVMRPEQYAGRRNIVHLAWEQKDGNLWWKAIYDRYDELWTISAFAATPFDAMFPGRVRVVPNVLKFDEFPDFDHGERFQGEEFKFLYAFDAGSSIERKNPEGVIEAFIKAFRGTQWQRHVELTLKVGGLHRPEYVTRVERLFRIAATSGMAVKFDSRQLSRGAMLELIAKSDCYISLHRSEGFGYTMAEAMAYGVPVVASGYSGNLEYMSHKNSFLVSCREVLVKSADGPFQRGSVWGDPNTGEAAEILRSIVENPQQAIAVGLRGQRDVRSQLSVEAIAKTVGEFL